MDCDERSKKVLKAIVLSYIKTAAPVGSEALNKGFDFKISSATIRNIMSDLEEQGFLAQPHTSAGRIPTDKGYRFYVDTLMQEAAFIDNRDEIGRQTETLAPREGARELLQDTSKLLSDLSHYTAIVTAPKFSAARIKHIDFVRLRSNRVLAISVMEGGFIQNKLLELPKDLSQKELNKISAYLNTFYDGLTLQEARKRIVEQMGKMKDLYDHLLSQALELTKRVMTATDGEVYLDGASHLVDLPEFSDLEVMKGLLNAFEEKGYIVQLLDKYIGADGVQVFIGAENAFLGDHHCSLVISPYKRGDQILGAVGVIGPTRMEYSKVISLVDSTAKQVGRLLEKMS